jgi:ubiquinone/menaquinone biosynthesis C-methylase UbiE
VDFIDYDHVAELYDIYASSTYDLGFFLNHLSSGTKVLELMSGTGRLSVPLIKAGLELTCVDISHGMVDVLQHKLQKESLQASILCADVQHLEFDQVFNDAILPFHSFAELVGKEKQMNTLRSVHRALIPNGRFFCPLHNPIFRKQTVDGTLRVAGSFKTERGHVVVSGFETGGNPIVKRSQFIEVFGQDGHLIKKILQPMEFEMIEQDDFRKMVVDIGFGIECIYGSYEGATFDSQTSPVMIWVLRKPNKAMHRTH